MRDPKERLIDILDAIAKIERHTGVGETDFENRMHGIIVITHPDRVGAGLVPAQEGDHEGRLYDTDPDRTTGTGATTRVAPTVGGVVGAFKSRVTAEYTCDVRTFGWSPPGCVCGKETITNISSAVRIR